MVEVRVAEVGPYKGEVVPSEKESEKLVALMQSGSSARVSCSVRT